MAAISALVCPAQIRSRTSRFAPGQAERMLAGGGALADRDRTDAQLAHRAPDDAGSSDSAEIVADTQGLAKGGLLGRTEQDECRVVGAADLLPQLGPPSASRPRAAAGTARRVRPAARGPSRYGSAMRRPRRTARDRCRPRPDRPVRPRGEQPPGRPPASTPPRGSAARARCTGDRRCRPRPPWPRPGTPRRPARRGAPGSCRCSQGIIRLTGEASTRRSTTPASATDSSHRPSRSSDTVRTPCRQQR